MPFASWVGPVLACALAACAGNIPSARSASETAPPALFSGAIRVAVLPLLAARQQPIGRTGLAIGTIERPEDWRRFVAASGAAATIADARIDFRRQAVAFVIDTGGSDGLLALRAWMTEQDPVLLLLDWTPTESVLIGATHAILFVVDRGDLRRVKIGTHDQSASTTEDAQTGAWFFHEVVSLVPGAARRAWRQVGLQHLAATLEVRRDSRIVEDGGGRSASIQLEPDVELSIHRIHLDQVETTDLPDLAERVASGQRCTSLTQDSVVRSSKGLPLFRVLECPAAAAGHPAGLAVTAVAQDREMYAGFWCEARLGGTVAERRSALEDVRRICSSLSTSTEGTPPPRDLIASDESTPRFSGQAQAAWFADSVRWGPVVVTRRAALDRFVRRGLGEEIARALANPSARGSYLPTGRFAMETSSCVVGFRVDQESRSGPRWLIDAVECD